MCKETRDQADLILFFNESAGSQETAKESPNTVSMNLPPLINIPAAVAIPIASLLSSDVSRIKPTGIDLKRPCDSAIEEENREFEYGHLKE